MKKLLAILLALTMVLTLGACGSDKKDKDDKEDKGDKKGGSGYEQAFERAMKTYLEFDSTDVKPIVPDVVWEEAAEMYNMDVDELVADVTEEVEEDKASYEEEGISYTYEIGEYEKLDSDALAEIKESIADCHESIDEEDIGDTAYSAWVYYEVTYEYEDETEEEEEQFFIVEIDGKWYVAYDFGFFCLPNLY